MSRRDGRKPALTEEDRRLWAEVRRSVKPLAGDREARPRFEPETGPVGESALPSRPPANVRQPLPSWRPPEQDARRGKVARMDDKTARKLQKGRLSIDARIDLHGMAETQAHNALLRFLERARREDCRIVLVITGKGERSGGILRRAVPRWLAEPPLDGVAGSWRQAHASHGGEGALYVRLRRRADRYGPSR